jgi:hypothetical protein
MDKDNTTLKTFVKTVFHFFPDFFIRLKAIKDPRDKNKIRYSLKDLILTGLLLFVLKLGARREIKYQLNKPNVLENLKRAFQYGAEKIAHGDTLNVCLSKLAPDNFSNIRILMIRGLIRKKCFEKYRLLGKYYLIVIDGTQHLCFSKRHCEHCLKKKLSNGQTIYYHPVLEAKLILPFGMALSIATEFTENIPFKSKQDCELKALYRLLPKIKSAFPQLRICIGGDSLYANKNVIKMMEEYNWKYIITFKKGSIPTVYQEFEALLPLEPKNRLTYREKDIHQDYQWIKDIDHEGHLVNVLSCYEIKKNEAPKKFVWITNLNIKENNCFIIGNEGGRNRWKIENQGFNMQKRGGYNLEHAYSSNVFAVKNFYLLLQIAHIIAQFMEYGLLGKKLIQKGYGAIKNIAQSLGEELRRTLLDHSALNYLSKRVRITLNSP